MSMLIFLVVIGLFFAYQAGPKQRAAWKRNVTSSKEAKRLEGWVKENLPPEAHTWLTDDRSADPPPPRRSFPQPPPPRPSAQQPPPPRPARHQPPPPRPTSRPWAATPPPEPITEPPDDAPAAGLDEPSPQPPEPSREDVDAAEPRLRPTAPAASEPPLVQPTTPDESDLELEAVVATIFGGPASAHERAAHFTEHYAGRRVRWTATAVRSTRVRRQREPAVRVELVLGFLSERQLFSDRVTAEAYFGPDAEFERDSELTFTAVLREANVYARRLVLDGAEVVAS